MHIQNISIKKILFILLALTSSINILASDNALFGRMIGNLPAKYDGDTSFPWANSPASKGGTLTLGTYVPFDTVNPYTVKGIPATLFSPISCTPVFEALACSGIDETFSMYGRIALRWEEAQDKLSSTYYINPKAKFSDGKQITADDVVFTFDIVRSTKGNPNSANYFNDIKRVIKLNDHTVKFEYTKINPELTLIIGQQGILPKHIYNQGDFTRDFTNKAIGSGPYLLVRFEPGQYLEFQKNPDYWGNDEPFSKGKYNYDKIAVKAFKDPTVHLQGFFAEEFDIHQVNSARQWAVEISGNLVEKNYILKLEIPSPGNKGIQGFVMNTRKDVFKEPLVREALALSLDFGSMNKTLFYNQYFANESYFTNSDFAATGLPSEEELKILEPLNSNIPEAVFTSPMGNSLGDKMTLRQRLGRAKQLIEQAGYKIDDGVYEDSQGQELSFSILINNSIWQRIADPYVQDLKRLGIQARIDLVDPSIYEQRVRNFDYDMVVAVIPQSDSLGNEQLDFFGSDAAKTPGSRNYAGVSSDAVDELIDRIIKADSRDELMVASKAMDRILWYSYYLVPHWYSKFSRLAIWNKLDLPTIIPSKVNPTIFLIEYGWVDKNKENALNQAKSSNNTLPDSNINGVIN